MNHLEAGVYPHQCAGDVENPYPLINIPLQHSPLIHPYFKALNDRVYVGGTHIPQTSGNIISESHHIGDRGGEVYEVDPPPTCKTQKKAGGAANNRLVVRKLASPA